MYWSPAALVLAAFSSTSLACDSCEHSEQDIVLSRNVRRMQPDAIGTVALPRAPLEWGQLNFMHTSDTHGWLEGHLKEQNYGADWGDYVSFVKHMRTKAKNYDVDLLLVDTGDLHDGAGLSDATQPNGLENNRIFEEIDYDVLTPGNHELYLSEVTYEHFYNFSRRYGDRYVTSNIQVLNPATSQFDYMGVTHRYFTTDHGLRVMAFGVIFNFTGNSNASKVIPAAEMVKQQWFKDALTCDDPVDIYLLIGHNPARPTVTSSTFTTVYEAIRAERPGTPIQIFGGHNHIRDFAIYDDKTTALGSGRYCETLGWLSISGIESASYNGTDKPMGVRHPTRKAKKPGNATSNGNVICPAPGAGLTYSRRYLDWNRITFEYHAIGSQIRGFGTTDTVQGLNTSQDIYNTRQKLNLTKLYGCASQTWCVSCVPFLSRNSIYTLLQKAVAKTAVNESRAGNARLIIQNTGNVRFDLPKGPFTFDDSFIVSPWVNTFEYLPDVPYKLAGKVIGILNNGSFMSKRALKTHDFGFYNPAQEIKGEDCVDPGIFHDHSTQKRSLGRVVRRQSTDIHPGYVTKDDFGNDGDDTIHSPIPFYKTPQYYSANGTFPTDGSDPEIVDLIFLDFVEQDVLTILSVLGATYVSADVQYYLPKNFTTNTYLSLYAQTAEDWRADVQNCPIGLGIGYDEIST